jgi:CubicO group peptidase (beta-lactamase class C family)
VYKRAGMTKTSSPPEEKPMRGRSIGYTRESKKAPWSSNRDTLPFRGTAAGGGDSTVGDLLRFAQALAAHELLDAAHTALLTSPKQDTPAGIAYGYGFSTADRAGLHCIGHGGGAPGMNGDLAICANGYTVAVLANLDPPVAGRVADFILARLPN